MMTMAHMLASVRQPTKILNSYRIEAKNPFNRDQVEAIMKEVMDSVFSQYRNFELGVSVGLCRSVGEVIMEKIKEKRYDRWI